MHIRRHHPRRPLARDVPPEKSCHDLTSGDAELIHGLLLRRERPHVRNAASPLGSKSVPARLLGPGIRHSSLYPVAGFAGAVRREETKGHRSKQRLGQRDHPDVQRRLRPRPSIASLHRQTLRPIEIIVVDDGSTDETRAVAEQARALGLVDMVICHGTRCGRSAAINAAARFASGDLLLTVDADTVFEPTAVARLAAAFDDPRVGGASCNIAISNESELDVDRTSERRVPDVDQRRPIHARRRGRDRLPVRRLFDVSARCLPAAGRPRRRPRRGSGVQPAAAPPRLSHPLRAGRLGGNGRSGKRASACCANARAGIAMPCGSAS